MYLVEFSEEWKDAVTCNRIDVWKDGCIPHAVTSKNAP